MPELTPRLGLKKPLGSDPVSRVMFNENYDIIDEKVATLDDLSMHVNDSANPHNVTAEQVFSVGGIPHGEELPESAAPYSLFYKLDVKKLFIYDAELQEWVGL